MTTHVTIQWFRNAVSDRIAFICSFIVSASFTLAYLNQRGFGWDMDSLVSAAQFIKLVNPDIYGVYDFGTHPKLLSIIVFGLFHQVFGNFMLLTFAAILLNSFMVAILCEWVKRENGLWGIALLGISVNIWWYPVVVNCDNTAFSVPLIFIGLYFYFRKHRRLLGAFLLAASNLFRPGAEYILVCVVLYEAVKNRKMNPLTVSLLAISLIHSYFGIYLAYPDRKTFMELCLTPYQEALDQIPVYKHSVYALVPYIQSVAMQLLEPEIVVFTILASVGAVTAFNQKRDVRFVALGVLATLVLPIGIFVTGVSDVANYSKHLEFTIAVPVLASCCPLPRREWLKKVSYPLILAAGIYIFVIGRFQHGQYEIHPDGSGQLTGVGKQYKEMHQILSSTADRKRSVLISERDVVYFILDNGLTSKKIDLIEHTSLLYPETYEVIFLPMEYVHLTGEFESSRRTRYIIDGSHVLYVQ